jgi:hypothetical protein
MTKKSNSERQRGIFLRGKGGALIFQLPFLGLMRLVRCFRFEASLTIGFW